MHKEKRKVNLVGMNTLTISLPTKWVKEHKIKKGDELETKIEDNELRVSTQEIVHEKNIAIDVSELDVMVQRAVAAAYKAGYDAVRIEYTQAKELTAIQNTVDRSCHAYEILDIRNSKVSIQTIARLNTEDFETVFNKISSSVITMAADLADAMKRCDYELMQEIIARDKIVDRHCDFCRRMMNKGHTLPNKLNHPLYVICDQSEFVAGTIKEMCKIMIKKKLTSTKETNAIFEHIVALITSLYKLVHKIDKKKIRKCGELEKKIQMMIDDVCQKRKEDTKIIAYLQSLFLLSYSMRSAVLTMNIGQLEKRV